MARPRTCVYIDVEHFEGLKALKDRTGISEAEAIRRALTEYLHRDRVRERARLRRAAKKMAREMSS